MQTPVMGVAFECSMTIRASPEVVFDLSLSVDAHLESMAGSREQATAGVTTGMIGLGEEVTWRAVHFGIPFRMTSRVTELESPVRFVDEQVRGPFQWFRHEHLFEARGTGTLMTDRVSFQAPVVWGGLGGGASASRPLHEEAHRGARQPPEAGCRRRNFRHHLRPVTAPGKRMATGHRSAVRARGGARVALGAARFGGRARAYVRAPVVAASLASVLYT